MPTPPRLFALQDAAQLLSPDGRLTARSLRTMARRGQLQLVRVAGKDFVTEAALNDMVASATIPVRPSCPDVASLPDCTCAAVEKTTEAASGSFSMDRKRLALAQARMTAQELKKPSKNTSQKTTDHRVVPIRQKTCSSPK